jgi:phage/plasmid-associated DNA primase
MLKNAGGNLYDVMPSGLLYTKDVDPNKPNPLLFQLLRKRWVGISETLESEDISEGFFKLIGGRDDVKARPLNKDPISAKIKFLVQAATNHHPQFASLRRNPDGAYAILKRLELWELERRFMTREKMLKAGMDPENLPENVFPADEALEDKLVEYREAFMGLVMDSWDDWKAMGSTKPAGDATRAMVDEQDIYKSFVDENMAEVPNALVTVESLLEAFRRYCTDLQKAMPRDNEAILMNFDSKLGYTIPIEPSGKLAPPSRRRRHVLGVPREDGSKPRVPSYEGWILLGGDSNFVGGARLPTDYSPT